jgi:hypothetical protein
MDVHHDTEVDMADDPISYSVKGAVAATGYSRAYIYQKISAGLLDVRKDGGKTVIIGKSLRDYIGSLPAMRSSKAREPVHV